MDLHELFLCDILFLRSPVKCKGAISKQSQSSLMNLPEHIRMPFSSQFPVSLGNVSFRTLSVNSKHLK